MLQGKNAESSRRMVNLTFIRSNRADLPWEDNLLLQGTKHRNIGRKTFFYGV